MPNAGVPPTPTVTPLGGWIARSASIFCAASLLACNPFCSTVTFAVVAFVCGGARRPRRLREPADLGLAGDLVDLLRVGVLDDQRQLVGAEPETRSKSSCD